MVSWSMTTAPWSVSPDPAIVQGRLAQLPWYHQIALLEKLKPADRRLWYAAEAIADGWSRDILALHIDRRLHERAGKAITNFARTLPPADSDLAQQSTRDPYLFDFLGTADIRRERDLEHGLIDHVQKFLLELGQGFAFVGRQVHLEIGDDDFYLRPALLPPEAALLRRHRTQGRATSIPATWRQLGIYMAAVDDLLAPPRRQTDHRAAAVPDQEQRRRRIRPARLHHADRRRRMDHRHHRQPARRTRPPACRASKSSKPNCPTRRPPPRSVTAQDREIDDQLPGECRRPIGSRRAGDAGERNGHR